MKQPSLHILKSDLVRLLGQQGIKNPDQVATKLIQEGYNLRPRSRIIVYGRTQAIRQKLVKNAEVSTKIVAKFNLILHQCRENARHKFIKTIRTNDREYDTLKEVAQIAYDFAELYAINPREEGYKIFCQIGLDLIGKKYGLSKFKYYKERIFEVYENLLAINEDTDKDGTKEFYHQWQNVMLSYSNLRPELKEADKYVHIVFGRQEADDNKADYYEWILAQFDQLSWLNAIPELSQLYGKKAVERYQKHILKKNKVETKEVDNTMPTKYKTEEEQAYWEAIRNKRAK